MPPVSRSSRRYDIIVFGATGFTGRLVSDYLATKPKLRWAIAGRDPNKLQRVHKELAAIATGSVPIGVVPDILEANASDVKSLQALVVQTRVILTTVGPYQLYGEPLVSACAHAGTDYVDITGEAHWHKDMIDRYHSIAEANGALIVPQCGFDSLPSDLGTFFVVQQLQKQHKQGTKSVVSHYELKGGGSGGTAHSLFTLFETPGAMKKIKDPYLLNPEPSHANLTQSPRPLERTVLFPSYDSTLSRYTIPFFMASTNTKVVRRSAALKQVEGATSQYGTDFSYNEVWAFRYLFQALIMWLGLGVFFGLVSFPLTRPLIKRVLPSPGEGPSAAVRAKSWFKNTLIGEGERGARVVATVTGGCAGYGDTSKMLSEAALTLVEERDGLGYTGGVLTPAVVFGNKLIERLHRIGIKFTVVEDKKST